MDIAATAKFMYDRLGRYLTPIPDDGLIDDNEGKKAAIREGVCLRTGVTGPIVDYVERKDDNRVIVPTLVYLLWLFRSHVMLDDGKPSRPRRIDRRLLAFTENDVRSDCVFATEVPNFVRYQGEGAQNRLLRDIAGKQCLFLAFSSSPSTVLGNGLRWSIGDQLEVNGRLALSRSDTIQNTAINIGRALAITQAMTRQNAIEIRWRLLRERSDHMQQELEAMVKAADLSLDAIKLLYNSTEQEMILAYRLWKTQ